MAGWQKGTMERRDDDMKWNDGRKWKDGIMEKWNYTRNKSRKRVN